MLATAEIRLLVSVAILFFGGSWAHGAALTLDAPEGCVDQAMLEQEVADLVGRPLAGVAEADFRLTISQQPGKQWHLKLEAIEHRPGKLDASHVRELDAKSCDELVGAAAVAIGASIRAFAEPVSPPATTPAPRAAEVPSPTIARVSPAAAAAQDPWRPALLLSLAADSGELPGTGLGVLAGGALRRRSALLAVTLGWFPPRDTLRAGGTGGRFQLASGAADGCFAPAWGTWTVLGCAGAELGVYAATGLGVPRPESRMAFWRAGRVSLGAALALNGSLALLVQATAIVPWSRPGFVLDGTTLVYRPDALAVRMSAGLDFVF